MCEREDARRDCLYCVKALATFGLVSEFACIEMADETGEVYIFDEDVSLCPCGGERFEEE